MAVWAPLLQPLDLEEARCHAPAARRTDPRDLGGAAGRLGRDRVKVPSTPVRKYFTGRRGVDYGADSNLEGDVAAYIVASGASTTSLQRFGVPPGALIADAIGAFF